MGGGAAGPLLGQVLRKTGAALSLFAPAWSQHPLQLPPFAPCTPFRFQGNEVSSTLPGTPPVHANIGFTEWRLGETTAWLTLPLLLLPAVRRARRAPPLVPAAA